VIRWSEPGYVVAFTLRTGGVSTGPYAALNLGLHGDDDPTSVTENRRRACGELDADPARLAWNRQVHGCLVRRAEAGSVGDGADGSWTDEPGVPLLALAADCVPVALARTSGPPALAVIHAGWRGLDAGVVEAGIAALGGGRLAAVVGPAIGPCCYEVGPEVSERFDADLTREGRLDLWTAAERRLQGAGVARVERIDLCTACNPLLFFSHRRDGGVTGRQGVIGHVV
jgi:YfiH family protein